MCRSILHAKKFQAFKQVQDEVADIQRSRAATQQSAPMDIGALKGGKDHKGKPKRGKDPKGRSKGNGRSKDGGKNKHGQDFNNRKCFYCDEIGHVKDKCQRWLAGMHKAAKESRTFLDKGIKPGRINRVSFHGDSTCAYSSSGTASSIGPSASQVTRPVSA